MRRRQGKSRADARREPQDSLQPPARIRFARRRVTRRSGLTARRESKDYIRARQVRRRERVSKQYCAPWLFVAIHDAAARLFGWKQASSMETGMPRCHIRCETTEWNRSSPAGNKISLMKNAHAVYEASPELCGTGRKCAGPSRRTHPLRAVKSGAHTTPFQKPSDVACHLLLQINRESADRCALARQRPRAARLLPDPCYGRCQTFRMAFHPLRA